MIHQEFTTTRSYTAEAGSSERLGTGSHQQEDGLEVDPPGTKSARLQEAISHRGASSIWVACVTVVGLAEDFPAFKHLRSSDKGKIHETILGPYKSKAPHCYNFRNFSDFQGS